MKTVLGYLLTPVFHLYFGLILVIFHLPQVIGHKLFGDHARRKVVDTLNFFLVKGLYLMGCRVKFSGFDNLPENRPIIIVSNHQSLYDIPAIVHGFKKHYPKFISKIELGKNLPSISYNLVHGKSALIDRSNGSQSIKEIFKLGRLIQANNYAACIFPEGTRSKTGRVKKFKIPGISTLLRAAPDAVIVPFAIDGHSRMMYKGMFPLKFGEKISYTALEPIEPKGKDVEQLVADIQSLITNELKR
ncbi:lysophospholipid acyltransferase family protein [Carboxylicivirga sp. RSCT41]|uniref:lysophospholipid acyltransferase family protein n=1 Tax=Carboxylicivirga agarovorans TaxID=3417570 RepID=UPI003D324EA0